jgi:cell division protein FtsL
MILFTLFLITSLTIVYSGYRWRLAKEHEIVIQEAQEIQE